MKKLSLSQRFEILLNRTYLAKLARDPKALGFFLTVSADAEANGEGRVFPQVERWLEANGHPQLARLVRKHAEDEVRHELLMLAALASLGREPAAIPDDVKVIDRLGRRLSAGRIEPGAASFWERPIESGEDVARAYLLLYAVERRAMERFAFMVEALRPVHPEIAATFEAIAKDERAHLHYCVAVSRAALPGEAAWTRLRDEMIEVEAEEYTANSKRFLWHTLDHEFETLGTLGRLFWKTARRTADLLGRRQDVLPVGGAEAMPAGRPASGFAAA